MLRVVLPCINTSSSLALPFQFFARQAHAVARSFSKASPAKVAVTVTAVVIFGTLAIFLYPIIWHAVDALLSALSQHEFGIYTGSAMHEVVQVVAARHAIGADAENAAVLATMLRVTMLAPFLVVLAQIFMATPFKTDTPFIHVPVRSAAQSHCFR